MEGGRLGFVPGKPVLPRGPLPPSSSSPHHENGTPSCPEALGRGAPGKSIASEDQKVTSAEAAERLLVLPN